MENAFKLLIKRQMLKPISKCSNKKTFCRFSHPSYCLNKRCEFNFLVETTFEEKR